MFETGESMFLGTAILSAAASPPDRTVRLFGVDPGGGFVERMQLSSDGALLVGRTRTSMLGFLLNTETWETEDEGGAGGVGSFVGGADCAVEAVTTVPNGDDTWRVWVACGDGRALLYDYDGTGQPVRASGTSEFTIDDQALNGLWYDPVSQVLYGLSVGGSGQSSWLHAINANGEVDGAGGFLNFPKAVPSQGFLEGVVVTPSGGGASSLVITHGANNMSHLVLGDTNTAVIPNGSSGGFSCNDLCPSPDAQVYCVDTVGSIAKYSLVNQQFQSLGLRLDEPRGVGASLDPTDGWLAVTGNQVFVWRMSDASTVVTADGPYYESPPDADNPIQDIVTHAGYMFGGGEAGYVHVVTANPWVYPRSIEIFEQDGADRVPATVFTSGDEGVIAFSVNQADVSYELVVGGGRLGAGGRTLGTGEARTAVDDETWEASHSFTVDDRFDEGPNRIWVQVENAKGDRGHAVGVVEVDNPPGPPGVQVGFAERALDVVLHGIPDVDLDHYTVWISDAPFRAQDWPTGGPTAFRGAKLVTAAPGTDPSFSFRGLENDHAYYIAARSYDASGKESAMSAVKSGVPRDVFSAAEEIGEPGGIPCATGAGPVSGVLAGLALAVAVVRRRSGALLPLLLLGLGLPGVARAQEKDRDDPWWRQDTTSSSADFEVRYGVISLVDDAINDHYQQNPHNLLQVETGPQFFRVVELDAGTGFFQELSFASDASGTLSNRRTMLTWFPLQLDGTLRLHVVDEQPVVPFVRYGWDYVIWSEKTDVREGGPKAAIRGGKFGTHYALGGNFLLDLLQPGRASVLEARTGINDSWLTLEWRRQHVDARERPWSGRTTPGNRLDFSGDSLTLGLKLDW